MANKKTIGANPFSSEARRMSEAEDTPPPKKRREENMNQVNTGSGSSLEYLHSLSQEFVELHEQISKNAHRSEKQTNLVTSASKSLTSFAFNLSNNVDKVKSATKKITNQTAMASKASLSALKNVDSTNDIFSNMLESSKDLDKIDKMIGSLAQQINLFALNASIEAARAGEHGRGFSVVANEIKELSKEAAKIAEDVRMKIEGFYQDTKRTVDALNEISNLILSIKNSQATIDEVVEEQDSGLGEISKQSGNISKISNNITDNLLGLYKTAKASTENADKAIRYGHTLSKIAGELKERN